jgi:Uma2 family endonuclease
MSLPVEHIYTADEYLALERDAETRHEFVDGMIYAMAGESPEHSVICTNLIRTVGTFLKGGSCTVFSPNMKVLSGKNKIFAYPDVIVVCGDPQYYDDKRDVLINPTVIFEVLSPSTEAFDRGEKFVSFRKFNRTLTDYILVSQHKPFVDHYSRRSENVWNLVSYEGLDKTLLISSLDCQLSVAEIYDRIGLSTI